MSDVLPRDEFERLVEYIPGDVEYADFESTKAVLAHDAAQRARIEELEAKLAALQHIGTGAGMEVKLRG